jgi:soluble lytic murein transglycosylase-like protein
VQNAHPVLAWRQLRQAITALLALLWFPDTAPGAEPQWSCEAAARSAAAEHGIPPDLMLAIALAESGRTVGPDLRPWPWTVNEGGKGRWFSTRAEAEAHVSQALRAGVRNIDLGCFQINHRWHGARFASVSAMFDPLQNARYAAEFLSELRHETGDWLRATGAYHSRTPDLAARYRARVETLRLSHTAPLDADGLAREPAANRFPLLQAGAPGTAASLVPDTNPAGPMLAGGAPRPLFGG